MIFCVCKQPGNYDQLPYVRTINTVLVYSSVPLGDCNFFGYRLWTFSSGNWWSIDFNSAEISFSRSVLSDYRWGYDSDSGILLTNHPRLIKKYFNPLTTSASVDCRLSVVETKKYQLTTTQTTRDLEWVTEEVRQRLLQNFEVLVTQYNCQHVSYSTGLDSSVNVLNSLSKPMAILITEKTHGYLSQNGIDFPHNNVVSMNLCSHVLEFGTSQVDQHFYNVQRVIDGSYGDLTLGHTGFFSRLPPEERLKFSTGQIYDSRPSNLPPLATRNQILYELVNTAVHEARRGIFSDHCIYDTYRDIGLLEMLMQLSTAELIRQLITGHIQKCILAGSGLLVTQHKGQMSSLYIA